MSNEVILNSPSKHFNFVSMLSFGWYDVAMWYNLKSKFKQRCVFQRWNLQRQTMSNQRCNVDVSNVIQRWNNVFLFNVEFHNVGQRGSYVVKMTISKRNKKIISTWIHCIYSFYCYFIIFFTLLPILRRIRWRILAKLRIMKNTALHELDLNHFTL